MPDEDVVLRRERGRGWSRTLDARVDPDGTLHIEWYDHGGDAALMSPDAGYEWHETIDAADIPRLAELLGGAPDEAILDVLRRSYTGEEAGEFERILRENGIDTHLTSWA